MKAEKLMPKDLNHSDADFLRDRLNDLKIEVYLLEGQTNAALGIFNDKISRETDMEEKIKLMIKKTQHEIHKIRELEKISEIARENELKMAEADCLTEIGKAQIENDDPSSALKSLYESYEIMEKLLSKNSKKTSLLQSLIGKCHILCNQEELGLGLLKKNHKYLESSFGIVSEESAFSLRLIGSVELALGNLTHAYKRLTQAREIFQTLNPKHQEVNLNQI